MDLGSPIAVSALQPGPDVRVFSGDGDDVGAVQHVLYDGESDIFDGLVIDVVAGPGGLRFVDAPHVREAGERGVQVDVASSAIEALPEPSASPAAIDFEPDDDGSLERKLKLAWRYVSGDY